MPRRTTIRAGVAAAVLAAGVAVSPTAAAAPAGGCAVTPLPLPAGAVSGTVDGSSPDGHTLVGYARTAVSPADGAAVVWRDGAIAATAAHAPGPLVDLNAGGDGVGDSVDGLDHHHPWVYHDGTAAPLSGEGTARAIGDQGQLVGDMPMDTTNGPPVEVPAVWPQDAQSPQPLATPGTETGSAADVAPDGTIVGTVGQDAYVWHTDGTGSVLPRPAGTPALETVRATSVDGQWVSGSAPRVGAVLWNLTTGAVDVVPGLDSLSDTRVNATGSVIGTQDDAPTAVVDGHAVALPALPGHTLNHPVSIDADAKLFGGTAQTGANPGPLTAKPVFWSCP